MESNEELLDRCYKVCYELTRKAGQIIYDAIGETKNIQTKSCDIDFVTDTDQKVEELLIGGLKQQFPTHKFIGEESTAAGAKNEFTDAPTWIIDPVDGTMNFVHKFPLVAISIGFYIKKQPMLAIIYNPILEQMFTARVGKGAYLNGEPIHVSGKQDLSEALITTEIGTAKDPAKNQVIIKNFEKLIGKVHGIRSLGSAAVNIASVASGGLDVYYEFGIHAWDIAAGILLVQEAGGACIDTAGGPVDILSRRVICASSMQLAKQLAETLVQYDQLERD